MADKPPISSYDEPIDESGADEVVERLKQNKDRSSAALPDAAKLALKMKGLGFTVMPLPTNQKSPPPKDWVSAAKNNPAVFLANPGTHNYAVLPPPDCFGWDVDKGVPDLLVKVAASLGVSLPDTLMTFTPNGRHQFYRWPTALPRPKGAMFGEVVTRWPAGDEGQGYLVGPGSVVVQDNGTLGVYHAYGLDDPDGIADLPLTWAQAALDFKPPRATPPPPSAGVLAEVGEHYEMPERVPEGMRYDAVRTYTAHLYNRGLSIDEMWPMVETLLAPRFDVAKSRAELRGDFHRATVEMDVRLGEPKALPTLSSSAPLLPAPVAPEAGASVAEDVKDVQPLFVPLTPFLDDLNSREPIGYLVDGWVPASGLTMWAGHPKSMKSLALLQLLGAYVAGGEFLGRDAHDTDTRVGLYLTREGSHMEMQKRVQALHDRHGADLGERLRFAYEQPIVFDRDSYTRVASALAELESEFSLLGKPLRILLVLDPMRDLMTAGADENEAKTIGLVKTWCRTMMSDFRSLSIVLVHHLRKSADGNTGLEMSGSGAVYGATDSTVIWKAKKETVDEDSEVLVSVQEMYGSYRVETRGDAPFAGKWRYDMAQGLIVPGVQRVVSAASGIAVRGTAKAALIDVLSFAERSGASVTFLAQACDVSEANVRAQLSKLAQQNRVVKEGVRWYLDGRAPHQQDDVILPVDESDARFDDPMHSLND
jgi:hypothetical protein